MCQSRRDVLVVVLIKAVAKRAQRLKDKGRSPLFGAGAAEVQLRAGGLSPEPERVSD